VASLVIGSFGSSAPYKSKVFDLQVSRDTNVPLTIPEVPLRYAAEPEIHHIFKSDPQSPPKIITIVFAAAVVGALPILFGVWATLGANASHLGKALSDAPVSHALFYGSSCTTPVGTFSRPCPPLELWGLWLSSVEAGP
jgi:oligosaccharyltransferase complex subunit delta (ribophorin II)